jgi:Protein of unknown function (DUF3703)
MSQFARRIHASIQRELSAASQAEARGDAALAFRHLERAHVLGQSVTSEHVRVHGRMLGWAIRQRKGAEAVGQVWRLAAAAVMTAIGWLPEGNTGGANVSGVRPMPIPPDLRRVLDNARG